MNNGPNFLEPPLFYVFILINPPPHGGCGPGFLFQCGSGRFLFTSQKGGRGGSIYGFNWIFAFHRLDWPLNTGSWICGLWGREPSLFGWTAAIIESHLRRSNFSVGWTSDRRPVNAITTWTISRKLSQKKFIRKWTHKKNLLLARAARRCVQRERNQFVYLLPPPPDQFNPQIDLIFLVLLAFTSSYGF